MVIWRCNHNFLPILPRYTLCTQHFFFHSCASGFVQNCCVPLYLCWIGACAPLHSCIVCIFQLCRRHTARQHEYKTSQIHKRNYNSPTDNNNFERRTASGVLCLRHSSTLQCIWPTSWPACRDKTVCRW